MRLMSIENCKEGMKIARAIMNDQGQILIHEDVTLTERMIDRLRNLHINHLYIADSRTNDIQVHETISRETRSKALKAIHERFTKITRDPTMVDRISDNPEFAREFKQVIKEILKDVQSHDHLMNVLVDVQSNDEYTFQHSLNVTLYAIALGKALSYNERQLMELGVGAILHDVGKLLIPLDVIKKPGSLTDEEFILMQEHTTKGFELLRKMDELSLLSAHCAFQHHERLNGTGYPRRLKNEEIHEYAKVVSVADVFDALTSHRSYRKAMLPHVAMELLQQGAGTLFDEHMVQLFSNTIAIYPIGVTVRLSNGMYGVVVDHNRNQPAKPVVRLIQNEHGIDLDHPEEVDLSKRTELMIEECQM